MEEEELRDFIGKHDIYSDFIIHENELGPSFGITDNLSTYKKPWGKFQIAISGDSEHYLLKRELLRSKFYHEFNITGPVVEKGAHYLMASSFAERRLDLGTKVLEVSDKELCSFARMDHKNFYFFAVANDILHIQHGDEPKYADGTSHYLHRIFCDEMDPLDYGIIHNDVCEILTNGKYNEEADDEIKIETSIALCRFNQKA